MKPFSKSFCLSVCLSLRWYDFIIYYRPHLLCSLRHFDARSTCLPVTLCVELTLIIACDNVCWPKIIIIKKKENKLSLSGLKHEPFWSEVHSLSHSAAETSFFFFAFVFPMRLQCKEIKAVAYWQRWLSDWQGGTNRVSKWVGDRLALVMEVDKSKERKINSMKVGQSLTV